VTSDPGPGSDDFPLPSASDGEPAWPANGQPEPPSSGQTVPGFRDQFNGQFNGQPPYGPPAYGSPAYGPPSYGPVPPYGPMQPYGQAPYGQLPYGQPGAVHPGMLTATADRERTMDVLKAAYGEGRITKEEFELRAGRAMSARTYAQLAAVVADLPAGPHLGVMPYQPGYYPVVNTPTSGLAIGSLVCGILELFTLGFAAIPAVILGHLARTQIRRTGERGDGMAIAGLVLGYLGIGIWTLIIIALALKP
jgi:Domain of unknown function (DUF4190)/Domain of unknown function (DUF1707)